MANILCIETSGPVCSAAISVDGNCIHEIKEFEKNSHSKYLTLIVEKLLSFLNNSGQGKLEGIALSLGPGSYTGLRIGTSVAKGLAFGLDLPVMGMPSTEVMARGFYRQNPVSKHLVCPMIDARRMEVYSAVYTPTIEVALELSPVILTESSYSELLKQHKICFVGDGAPKFEEIVHHSNATFDNNQYLLASEMASRAEQLYQSKELLDTAYFEPNYLKEFMALTSKKKFF